MRGKQLMLAVAVLGIAVSMAGQAAEIRRLDRSSIERADMDRTVERLMKTAKGLGVGLALFNDGNVGYEFKSVPQYVHTLVCLTEW
jgi:hypothetical protein